MKSKNYILFHISDYWNDRGKLKKNQSLMMSTINMYKQYKIDLQ